MTDPATPGPDSNEGTASAVPSNDATDLAGNVLAALSDKIEPVRVGAAYRLGLFAVALAVCLLSLVYAALVAGVEYATYWHATNDLWLVQARVNRGSVVLYVLPLLIGAGDGRALCHRRGHPPGRQPRRGRPGGRRRPRWHLRALRPRYVGPGRSGRAGGKEPWPAAAAGPGGRRAGRNVITDSQTPPAAPAAGQALAG